MIGGPIQAEGWLTLFRLLLPFFITIGFITQRISMIAIHSHCSVTMIAMERAPGRMKKGSNKKNFEVYSAENFIAAITQHIPNKFSQLIRYYGFLLEQIRGNAGESGTGRKSTAQDPPSKTDTMDFG